jgi:hypothetical protein
MKGAGDVTGLDEREEPTDEAAPRHWCIWLMV